MSKYFREKESQKKTLSSYLEQKVESYLFDEQIKQIRTKYIMDILGDISLSEDIYRLFIEEFQKFGGMYDVRTTPETFKGIYQIVEKHPELTTEALEEIWSIYIKDLFDEYSLENLFEKYLKDYGESDYTLSLYIDKVKLLAKEYQKKYEIETLKLEELSEEYSKQFIIHLKFTITRKHYTYDKIKKYLPSAELIKKDEEHIISLSTRTRIFFGCCQPVSYSMFDYLLEDKTLKYFEDFPTYYISTGDEEKATFTKEEFLKSIKGDTLKKIKNK